MQWVYKSPLDAAVCLERLCSPQIGSVDELNPFNVEIKRLSDAQVRLVYKGRRFSRYRRTEYLVSLSVNEPVSSETIITVMFEHDLFNLQYPVTPISELDAFLKESLSACRKL